MSCCCCVYWCTALLGVYILHCCRIYYYVHCALYISVFHVQCASYININIICVYFLSYYSIFYIILFYVVSNYYILVVARGFPRCKPNRISGKVSEDKMLEDKMSENGKPDKMPDNLTRTLTSP